jgi:hypothetical protein
VNKYLIILIIFCFSACKKEEFLKKEIQLNSFSRIEINHVSTVEIIQDNTYSLEIEGDSKALKNFIYEIVGDTLKINSKNKNEKVTLKIHCDSIKELFLLAPCNISNTDTIKGNNLMIWTVADICQVNFCIYYNHLYIKSAYTSISDIKLNGKVFYADFWAYYGTKINAIALQTNYAYIRNHSTANWYLCVNEYADVCLYATGGFYYKGNAVINEMKNEKHAQIVKMD